MARKIRKMVEDGASGSESSEAIGSNEDLLTLILLFLPVISLIRFKSVSKSWHSLITSHRFSHLKSTRFSKRISGLLLERIPNSDPTYEFVPLDEALSATRRIRSKSPLTRLGFIPAQGDLEVVQYCNGLLLLCTKSFRNGTFYVLNPTTRDYVVAPVRDCVRRSGGDDFPLIVNLAFDPRKSLHYKLICIYLPRPCISAGEFNFRVGIYSSETDVFKQAVSHLSRFLGTDYRGGLYWNGSVYWINPDCGGVYFNVDEERFGTFPRPPASNEEGASSRCITMYYGECNDHLHLIRTTGASAATSFDVCEMDKGYSGWFVKFRVDLEPVLSSFGVTINNNARAPYGVLGVVREDEDAGKTSSFLVLSIPGRVIRYDFDDGSFWQLCFASTNDRVHDWTQSIPFIGSLHRL